MLGKGIAPIFLFIRQNTSGLCPGVVYFKIPTINLEKQAAISLESIQVAVIPCPQYSDLAF
jgi:hypothetical protein